MGAHCGHHNVFDGNDPYFQRALLFVIAINFLMFVIEVGAGHVSNSQALWADALDFFADAVTYTITLLVIGKPLKIRSRAALAKGLSLLFMAIWVIGSTVYDVFVLNTPEAHIMGVIGLMALLANAASVLILMRWSKGDSNVRSVWLCSRNDAIGNCAVMLAALGVWGTGTAWPDLIVAIIMGGLFLLSSVKIIKQSLVEMKLDKHH